MEIIIVIFVALLCIYKQYKIIKLKDKLDLLMLENLSLKKVMAQEGLIPKEYVK